MKFVVAFFFPCVPITKATINFQFPLAIKAEWPSGGQSAGIVIRRGPVQSSLSSLTAKRICSRVHLLGCACKKPTGVSGQLGSLTLRTSIKTTRLLVIVLPLKSQFFYIIQYMARVSEFHKRQNFTIDQFLNASIRGTSKKIVFILI